jgi:integrase
MKRPFAARTCAACWSRNASASEAARGATEPITAKETAAKVWEPKLAISVRDSHAVLKFATNSPAGGHETKRAKPGARVDRAKLRQIDLHWHDLRHEGACRLLVDGVDIRIIQLMLGHASVQETQRYLNVTDEELRKGLEVSWKRRTLKAVAGGQNA